MIVKFTSLMRRAFPAAVGGLLVLAALSVSGALGSDNGTIFYACIESRSGTMYGFSQNSPPRCRIGDQYVSWGQVGPQGPPGISGLTAVYGDLQSIGLVAQAVRTLCPPGLIPVSGGLVSAGVTGPPSQDWTLLTSIPVAGEANPYDMRVDPELDPGEFGWYVQVRNNDTSLELNVGVTVLCAEIEASE